MREHSQTYYLWQLIRTVRNWPVYFLNRFGLMNAPEVTYKLRNGLKITTRRFNVDRCGINEVWLDRIYDPLEFDWKNCKTIIDVGANVGTFTLFAAAKAPNAKIVSLEPDPETAKILQKNITQNKLESRITMRETGMAAEEGTRTFYVTPRCSWFGSLYEPKGEHRPVTINVISLAKLFADEGITQCDFLKLDCEGAEYEILYTMPADLLAKIKFIALEYHTFVPEPRANGQDLAKFLVDAGFQVTERPNEVLFASK